MKGLPFRLGVFKGRVVWQSSCAAVFAVLFSVAASACPDHQGVGLTLVSSSAQYGAPGGFALGVSIENRTSFPLIVLPNLVRREYEAMSGDSVKYIPFPGPVLPPWSNAFVLQAGEIRTFQQAGMRDGDGTWDLAPGKYRLRLRYDVPPEFESSAGRIPDELAAGKLWTGIVFSDSITVDYRP